MIEQRRKCNRRKARQELIAPMMAKRSTSRPRSTSKPRPKSKSESNRDPDLNSKGVVRAENWKNYFISKNISRIYSTNYKRTIKTAIPLAENNNLEILIYSSDDIEYENFLKLNEGENTVVIGHSNTIPEFVNNLINEDYYEQIDDLNNSDLYIVSHCNSGLTHKLITVD